MEKSSSSDNKWRWIPHFLGRRFLRTYPNYLLFLLLNWLIIDTWRPESAPELWRYMTFTQSLLSPHPGFFGEAWSLVIEEIFYLFIPVIMFFTWRRSAVQALLVTLFILLVLSLMMRIIFVYSDPDLTFNQVRTTALLRLDSIMIGVLTCYIYYHNELWRDRIIKMAPFLSLLFIPVVVILMQPNEIMDESHFFKIFLFPITNIAAAGLLVFGINLRVNDLFYRLLRPVARWSYSAYLVNLLVLSAMNFYLPSVSANTALLYWFGFMFTTLFLSAFTYNFFERHILLWRDHWIK
ncbi:acyltransferase [Vibrio cholerae]|nr:acyltransferase [Vibrio cholerae]MCR9692608.1 acyltransferase [Vibrio cholerae]MCR9738589.1 acyltransferase [Vibrio cholerae]MCR9749312.1 acyltransferase [Vibrio cholerae]